MTSSVTAPLERQFGQMPGLNQMSSTRSAGASVVTLQFSLDPQPRRRRAGGAGRDQRRRQPAARRPARAADLRQGQPGRRADPHPRAHLARPCPSPRSRTWPTPAWRRRSSQHPGVGLVTISGGNRPAVRIAGQPARPRRLRPQHRRRAHHHRHPERQHAQGQLRRPGAKPPPSTPTTRSPTPASTDDLVIAYKNGAPGPPARRRHRRRRRGEQPARRLGQHAPRR